MTTQSDWIDDGYRDSFCAAVQSKAMYK